MIIPAADPRAAGSRRIARTTRGAVASLLGTLVVVLSFVVPLLDSAAVDRSPVLEAEHHATCVTGHDHTICTQVGANLVLTSEADAPRLPAEGAAPRPSLRGEDAASAASVRHHPARAPPAV